MFTAPAYPDLICRALDHCRKTTELRICGYVIMPDHLHLLTNVPSPDRLKAIFVSFRRFTATRIFEMLDLDHKEWALVRLRTGQDTAMLWDPNCHPIDASREDIFDQKLHYIHMNPVRTGFVREPEDWRYSSAAFYYHREPRPPEPLAVDRIGE